MAPFTKPAFISMLQRNMTHASTANRSLASNPAVVLQSSFSFACFSTVFFFYGTRCRDGVKVLWWRSQLVWLVFEGSIPTCACLHLAKIFVTSLVWIFFLFVVVIGSLSNLANHNLLEVHLFRALNSGKCCKWTIW